MPLCEQPAGVNVYRVSDMEIYAAVYPRVPHSAAESMRHGVQHSFAIRDRRTPDRTRAGPRPRGARTAQAHALVTHVPECEISLVTCVTCVFHW